MERAESHVRTRSNIRENSLFTDTAARRRALRIANRLALVGIALSLVAACSKTPDSPGVPGRPAPKAAVTLPGPADRAGIIRIPVSPADDSGAPLVPHKPSRVWI